MGAGLTEQKKERERGKKKGEGVVAVVGGGSFQLFLEATIVFVQDLPPFLLRLAKRRRRRRWGMEAVGSFSIVTMTKQASSTPGRQKG